jgi:hypothetical protein
MYITLPEMKLLLFIPLLSIFVSCNMSNSQNHKNEDTVAIIGSTVANINAAEFSLVEFEIESKLCFATINQYFKNYDHKSAFPYSLWVTVETVRKNDNGHPTDDEAQIFNDLEDKLIATFASGARFCYIGRTTRDGYREIMFYVSDKELAANIMNDFIKADQVRRKVTYEIELDKEWISVEGLYAEGD